MKTPTLFVLLTLVSALEASPLFEERTGELLSVEIETDLEALMAARSVHAGPSQEPIKGRFRIDDATFDVGIETRGHNRLTTCAFPPLKLIFAKSQVKHTILQHNNKLKLVTHCHLDRLEMLFREHLVYKIYNAITPYSYQVRLVKMRYADSKGKLNGIDSFAFFIESSRSVRNRLKLSELEPSEDFNMKTFSDISPTWLNPSQVNLQEAFQHLIRNNDWVIFHTGSISKLSVANMDIFYDKREGIPIPYDFDLAAIVTWDIESYEDRYILEGRCDNADRKAALDKIVDLKHSYLRLVHDDPNLDSGYKQRLIAYFDGFRSVDDLC